MHKTKSIIISFFLIATLTSSAQDLKLWYKQPATEWTAGLPIGNGKLMGIVQGGIDQENIQLNEETVWTGGHIERDKKRRCYL